MGFLLLGFFGGVGFGTKGKMAAVFTGDDLHSMEFPDRFWFAYYYFLSGFSLVVRSYYLAISTLTYWFSEEYISRCWFSKREPHGRQRGEVDGRQAAGSEDRAMS